jgi:hypothetical protein
MLFEHCDLRAASLAAWTAGKSNAIRTPIIAITTRSSTRVKAKKRFREMLDMPCLKAL